MQVITLTTDWGDSDHYVASFKGMILSELPGAVITDVSNKVEHFNIIHAAYIVRNCYKKFPKNTIHFIGVKAIFEKENDGGYVLIKCNDHYFIGHDSGIFSLVFREDEKEIVQLDTTSISDLSQLYEYLVSIIKQVATGKKLSSIGHPIDSLIRAFEPQPTTDENTIRAAVIYLDSFQNAVTNITRDKMEQVGKGRPFTIYIQNHDYSLKKVHSGYDDNPIENLLFFYNDSGNLMIALKGDSACKMLALKYMTNISIEFNNA